MNFKKILPMFFVSVVLMLCGCIPKKAEIQYIRVPNDSSMLELNKIALKAQRSAQVMAEIQNAQAQSSISLQGAKNAALAATATPNGWGTRINLNFQGPFDKLVIKLADKARYQFFTEGVRPANIPLVTVFAENKTLKQILDDVVVQLPRNIGVVMHPKTHTLLIIYSKSGA